MTPKFTEQELIIPGGATTVWYGQRTLNVFGKVKYAGIVLKAYLKINAFYRAALRERECYYGPFKGEFGHFLLHNLPFLTHLYKKGVKIRYCGMGLHRPFLVDEEGKSIIWKYHELRDFFAEAPPASNRTIPPPDVKEGIDKFYAEARTSGKPFLDIGDNDLYWFVFRNWQLQKGRQEVMDLSKVYGKKKENAAVIFPRKKGKAFTPNNGGPWDYLEVARAISPYFDKVYITGHPSLSQELQSEGNIEVCLSADNSVVLEKCSAARLIITQHSGAVHIGTYTNTPVLVIFNGEPPILGLIDTLRFRETLHPRYPLSYAFNIEQVTDLVRNAKGK